MRIIYLVTDPGIPLYGRKGCSTHVRETVLTLQRFGHEVKVVCSNIEGDDFGTRKMDVEHVKPLRSRKLGFDLRHILLDRRTGKRLEQIYREWKPDALYERYSLYCRCGEKFSKRHNVPRLLEVNAFLTREQQGRIRCLPLARRVERGVIGRSRNVIVVSRPLADEVRALGVPEEGISRMPMAVDLEKFTPAISGDAVRSQHGIDDRFVLGYVGTLAGWHGIRLLFDLAQELDRRSVTGYSFLIVGGEGEKLERNRQRARDEGLADRMQFIGSVVHNDVPEHIRAFDVALVPDMSYWNSPAKMFEYMASGVPVIAPEYPAIRDAIQHGRDGMIFPKEDITAMADAVVELKNNHEARQAMGRAARNRAEFEHSWDHNGHEILRLFEQIGAENRAAQ